MTVPMTPLAVLDYTLTTALGRGRSAQWAGLSAGLSGLKPGFADCSLACWVGEVAGLDVPIQNAWDCRNNRLAELGLLQDGFLDAALRLKAQHGAARVGVFIGTSTAGVAHTERAYCERDRTANTLPNWFDYRRSQNTFSAADYVRERLGLAGICVALSTACSSSAKVFAAAQRAITLGLCDAAVVGGVDSLCLTTLYGFNALQLISPEPCRPADAARRGISIGEAAAFALVAPAGAAGALALLGYGESSDAHHMSAPEPQGRGAAEAMQAALTRAGLAASAVDYVHLHGTATPANDLAEDHAVMTVFGHSPWCSSTKGTFGHTLGAAGMVGAAVALMSIERGLIPASANTQQLDPALAARYALNAQVQPVRAAVSNAFGFGGNNCSLLFGRLDDQTIATSGRLDDRTLASVGRHEA